LEETLHEINQVSRRQVRRLGDLLFDRRKLSLTVLGPGAKARPLKAFLAGS